MHDEIMSLTHMHYLYNETGRSLRERTVCVPLLYRVTKKWKQDSTSIDTALFLALTLWISSMNKLCMAEPFIGI